MKMQAVREKAKQFHLTSFGKTKESLIREIQRAEGNFDCFRTASDFCDQWSCCFREDCLGSTTSRKRSH